jgi:hypothetical protein
LAAEDSWGLGKMSNNKEMNSMVKRNSVSRLALAIVLIGFCVSFHLSMSGQESVDYDKILGEWDMEVDAGGEYFYLSFSIERTDSELKGSISEFSGFFSDVSLENIEFDGSTLIFEMNIPTPPDGYENLVKADFDLVEDRLEGTLSVESLGISAAATATKKSLN